MAVAASSDVLVQARDGLEAAITDSVVAMWADAGLAPATIDGETAQADADARGPSFLWDRALDPTLATQLAVLARLHTRARLSAALGIGWCGRHRGWMAAAQFWPDRASDRPQGSCKPCQRATRAARRAEFAQEEDTARARWREDNRDRDNFRRSAHARANPEQESARKARRNARIRTAERLAVSPDDVRRLWWRYSRSCACCRERIPLSTGPDHAIPYARGGRHAIGNLLPMCTSCNSSKRDRLLMEYKLWRKRRGLPVWAVAFGAGPRGRLP